jgi:GNAT superfamily N-acetyltransferase
MLSGTLFFQNPPLEALRSTHPHFALRRGRAWKYMPEVTPFAAIEDDSEETLRDLYGLMKPGELVYVIHDRPLVLDGLTSKEPFMVGQMLYPADRELPEVLEAGDAVIERLSCANAEEMVALTEIAFPGFFRLRTCEMGSYFGIRSEGRLVAMCGERMSIGEFREISGLCTHPDHRGKGYAQRLMVRVMKEHREKGQRSYLHVTATNPALEIYRRMGFEDRGEFPMVQVIRDLTFDQREAHVEGSPHLTK